MCASCDEVADHLNRGYAFHELERPGLLLQRADGDELGLLPALRGNDKDAYLVEDAEGCVLQCVRDIGPEHFGELFPRFNWIPLSFGPLLRRP